MCLLKALGFAARSVRGWPMCTVAECKDWLADVLSQVAKARQAHEEYAVLAGEVRCACCVTPHLYCPLSLLCPQAATRPPAMAAPES